MGEVYKMNIAGCERELPICPLNEHMDIAGFVMFSDVEITERAAQALLEDRLFSYLLAQIGEDGQVIDTSYTARVSEGQLHVTLTAECREEIGEEIPSTREIPGETPAE